MKLSKQQIQFIDTYLKNTHIEYVDVRMELLDHIVSALESDMEENNRSFYYAFKAYMVQNKKQLEKDYERLRKDLQTKAFGVLGRKMLTKPFLILFLISAFILLMFNSWLGFVFPYLKFIWGMHMVSALIYFLGLLPRGKYLFSSLQTLSWPILLSTQFSNIFFNFSYGDSFFLYRFPMLSIFITSIFFTATVAFLALFFEKRKAVKQKFASL